MTVATYFNCTFKFSGIIVFYITRREREWSLHVYLFLCSGTVVFLDVRFTGRHVHCCLVTIAWGFSTYSKWIPCHWTAQQIAWACKGYRMVPSNLKVLAKFGHCSNCLQKIDECSLARARKSFASAPMLGFSLKFPIPCSVSTIQKLTLGNNVSRMGNWETLGKPARAINVSGKISFCWRFIETDWPEFR